jgi:hypothetical protein
MHPSDDDLILLFYGEAEPADAMRMRTHLAACSSCQASFRELEQTMELVDAAAVPEPDAAFERAIWTRIEPALARPGRWSLRTIGPALALAAAVVLMIALGRTAFVTEEPAEPTATETSTVDVSKLRERVLFTALDSHFAQTELLLIELMNAPDDEIGGYEFERTAADDLLASGRLYRATAEQTGHLRLAQMLVDLEPVLVEVARSPEKVDRKEMSSLRSRIDEGDLLFKVRALTNDIRERQQDIVTANEGGL